LTGICFSTASVVLAEVDQAIAAHFAAVKEGIKGDKVMRHLCAFGVVVASNARASDRHSRLTDHQYLIEVRFP
jgi:hypothetical protein